MLELNPEALIETNENNEALFQFMEKLIFDVLAMTSENKNLIDITKLYIRMLQLNNNQTMRLIDKKFLMKEAEAKDEKEFFETLLSHMDRDVREMSAQLLLHCVNRCFETQNLEVRD